jgi:hypothetical protein
VIGSRLRLSDSPIATSPAPPLGEHGKLVLTMRAGYTTDEVRQLRARGVI